MTRSLLAAGCAALALAVAGCGGDDASEKDRYASSVDRFCREVTASVERVQSNLAGAQGRIGDDREKAAEAVGGALTSFAGDVDRSLDQLRGVEVPDDYRRFHDGATSGLGRVVTALRDAGGKAKGGDVQALAQLGPALQDIRVPEPPAELRDKAPACRSLQRAAG